VAGDDSFTIAVGGELAEPVDRLFENDLPREGLSLETFPTLPQYGQLELRDGVIYYRPASDFQGVDRFTYIVTNGVSRDEATVTINVVPPNGRSSDPNEVAGAASIAIPLPEAIVGAVYLTVIVASDLNQGDWLVEPTSVFPPWLSVTDNPDGTVVLTGTPTEADVGEAKLALVERASSGMTSARTFVILVKLAP
jgi:hypothetical protein